VKLLKVADGKDKLETLCDGQLKSVDVTVFQKSYLNLLQIDFLVKVEAVVDEVVLEMGVLQFGVLFVGHVSYL